MSLKNQGFQITASGHPITTSLGESLVNRLKTVVADPLHKLNPLKPFLKNPIPVSVTSFRTDFKPELADFIFQFFAIDSSNNLILLFTKNPTYDVNRKLNGGDFYQIVNTKFTSIDFSSEAKPLIEAYENKMNQVPNYSKCLWSEFTNEMDAYYIASNVSEWEIQFGYVDKGIIPIPPASSPLLSNYEKNYLNNYHDHLTAVSIIKTSSGSTEYRDADNICPPRCIV